MFITIPGTYSNGVVVLDQQPPALHSSKVTVTFSDETDTTAQPLQRPKAGFGKGTFVYIAPDFDAPIDDMFDCLK